MSMKQVRNRLKGIDTTYPPRVRLLYQGGQIRPARFKRVLKWFLWALVGWLPFNISLSMTTGWGMSDWQTWFMILPVTWILAVDFIRRKW